MIKKGARRGRRRSCAVLSIAAATALLTPPGIQGDELRVGLNPLAEVEVSQLSQTDRSPLSAKALAIHSAEWKHAETDHFIYHYQKSYVATPVSVEAEFYFRVVVKELGKENVPWPEKAQVYIFEQPADWQSFQSVGGLEQWTGGIQSGGSLFIVRNPAYKFSDNTLGHEITHLVLFRLYGAGLPLWLNEGLAQFFSKGAHASYQRARGYLAKPHSEATAAAKLFPITQLSVMPYPPADQIETFYNESERLVRFLAAENEQKFRDFIEVSAKGETFERALVDSFGSRFQDVWAAEAEFKAYATKDGVNDETPK